MEEILRQFGLDASETIQFGDGLINDTYKVINNSKSYLLQKINSQVFKNPEAIAKNLRKANEYIALHNPAYFFINPCKTLKGNDLVWVENDVWRVLPFVENTKSINVISNESQAYLAASAFGDFMFNFSTIDLAGFESTIPDFHNLNLRYHQFQESLVTGNSTRKNSVLDLISEFSSRKFYIETYNVLMQNLDFPDRLVHHDTKINNVLFNSDLASVKCVCDLDTVMPGKVISDLGDMVRTYTCSESEESSNFESVQIVDAYYFAVMQGFLSKTKSILTNTEKENLFYAGQFMIYMQGLRFLTDYLNNDVYYSINHEKQNLNRAINQLHLLKDLESKETIFKSMINQLLNRAE
jgi:hypothetical protein